jgi:hypothetical protein
MVFDRLLLVLEGIHALLTPVPLYKHATGKIGDLLSRCARRQNKQTNGRGCRAKRFDSARPRRPLLVRRLKKWCAARSSILGASTVGSFHAVHSGSAFRTPLPSRSFHRPFAVQPCKHNADATRVSARRKTRKKSSTVADRVSNSPRHNSQQMTTAAMSTMSRLW